uniref:S-adenosylmethionine sensor upstream of mTORC1 n=1 Tax=Leptobrachium leishanense TaxID=445787 RepID=A0A8C5M996_9ANUR
MAVSSNSEPGMDRGQGSRAGLRAVTGESRAEGGAAAGPQRREGEAAATANPVPRDVKQEQERLAGVVKNVHRGLRNRYREVGDFNTVWLQHCQNEGLLCEYAVAMKTLAGDYWTKKCDRQNRINWCLGVCQDYFYNGGKIKVLEKVARREVVKSTVPLNYEEVLLSLNAYKDFHQTRKIKLLDVGSCYNPFLEYEEFLTVGIDIQPGDETVHRCDFLNLQIRQPLQRPPDAIEVYLRNLRSPIGSLPSELFDVVVFSLLLCYFPSRYQRFLCCKKAHELLALNGLLLIITPDSSHQNRHVHMMKSWKVAIESLGFKRMIYAKYSHMHVLAFRKNTLKTTCDLITRDYPGMLYIPQDFNNGGRGRYKPAPSYVRSRCEDEQLATAFSELPTGP